MSDCKKNKILIMTMGLSRIVKPTVENYNVVGVVEGKSKYNKYSRLKFFLSSCYRFLYSKQTLKKFCKNINVPYYLMDKGSDKNLEVWVREKKPDIIIVYSLSQLLRENIFSIPKYGTVNLHPSKLPKYRGPNPWFWTYYNMEQKGGITIHYIDEGEDTGDIIYQKEYQIPLGMKSPEMQDLAIKKYGNELIDMVIDNICNLPRIKQEKNSPTSRARNIKDNEHLTLINWKDWNVKRIWHILRGTELWMDAIEQPKGLYAGHRWNVKGVDEISDMSKYCFGRIYREDKKYFVACRDGKIYLSVEFKLHKFIFNIIRKYI